MSNTVSENRFEEFCQATGVGFQRLPTAPHQTPDYEVTWRNASIVVEVKEILPDEEDRRIQAFPVELYGERECTYYGGAPGERIRKKILKATKQLKGTFSKSLPRMIILVNLTSYEEVCDDYAMAVAMFGFEAALISPEPAPEGGATILRRWHSFGRRMTRHHCRSVSALASLSMPPSPHSLRIYHNPFAEVPLRSAEFSPDFVHHLVISGDPEKEFTAWSIVRIPPGF